MNDLLLNLEPQGMWRYFKEILSIPRPSKKEDQIRAYLIDFAKRKGLDYRCDETGNVLICKPAYRGYESRPTIVLQSHMDMVCEKNSETVFDFDQDAIQVEVLDGWLKAKGTTLGGDNGIGVACELAILDDPTIEHGPLECLFTVDEETGLTGAFGLKPDLLKGRVLLNLDSEDDGQFFIGCAGGIDTVIRWSFTEEALPSTHKAYQIQIKGLSGGHSGDDINKGRANSIKLANRIFANAGALFAPRLIHLEGGNLRNAIPREARLVLAVEAKDAQAFEAFVKEQEQIFKKELPKTEPDVAVVIEEVSRPEVAMSKRDAQLFSQALTVCPHGVIRMDPNLANFVETSTNLAAVRMDGTKVLVTTSQRSSVASQKFETAHMVAAAFRLIGAEAEHGEGYPGWAPSLESPILHCCMESYKRVIGEEPIALAIHAGLECGLIGETYPDMDMVSFGPTMRGVHSPDERLELSTVTRFWDVTLDVLKNFR